MMLIGARSYFSAGHWMKPHTDMHGHSYEVWVYVPAGGCVETLQGQVEQACRSLDHRILNDVPGLRTPSMENIARHIHAAIPEAVRVVVNRPVEGLTCEYATHDHGF